MSQQNIASGYTKLQPFVDEYALAELSQTIIKRMQAKGASAGEVSAGVRKGFSATVRLGEVDTVEHYRDKGVDITAYFGKQKGTASTSDLSKQAIDEAIDAACTIAKYIKEDACAGLAEPDLLARTVLDCDLYHPLTIAPDAAIEMARECEALGLAKDARITNSDGASFSTGEAYTVYANSHDFVGAYPRSRYSLNCCLVASSQSMMQRDYEYTTSRQFETLQSKSWVAERAADKALSRLGARRLKTTTAPVLFTPELARGLIATLVSAISGGNVYRQTTFLADALNQTIAPPWFNLTEQAHLPRAMGSAPFDGDGVATPAERVFVDAGVLQSYVLSSYSARRLQLQTTGNAGGVHNLTLAANAGDKASLLRTMGDGLLVTELMGQGIDLVTGDYSRGAAGFWVEKGQIQYPVHEITIAGNLRDMFKNCAGSGSDIDYRGSIRCGSLLLEAMTIAGAS